MRAGLDIIRKEDRIRRLADKEIPVECVRTIKTDLLRRNLQIHKSIVGHSQDSREEKVLQGKKVARETVVPKVQAGLQASRQEVGARQEENK